MNFEGTQFSLPGLCSGFQANLCYIVKPCIKNKQANTIIFCLPQIKKLIYSLVVHWNPETSS
jgi:hypothetical protein